MNNFTILEQNPPNISEAYVNWDSFGVGQDREILWTDGIASCLAITLYDSVSKRGILAHISGCRFPEISASLYPENIVSTLTAALGQYQGQLEATLAGEAFTMKTPISSIVKQKLQECKIPIVGEDLGEEGIYCGREVHFDCNTGKVKVYRYQ